MIPASARSMDLLPSAVRRILSIAPLRPATIEALIDATGRLRRVRTGRELIAEGQEITETQMIVSGWAARVRILADGRRQFLSFLLPGDLVGLYRQPRPVAVSSIVALTELGVCAAPEPGAFPDLDSAYGASQALHEGYLLAHIVRLGRLNAQERICDLLLELHERLLAAGLAAPRSFDIPLTQEMLADALGLTSVHVNRMLQQGRRDGDLGWKVGHVSLADPVQLARKIGRARVHVSAVT